MSKKVEDKLEKHFSKGYYEVLLKSGAIVGIPKKRLAEELETTEANIDEMIREYRTEISDLMIHRRIAGEVFEPLNRVRMSKLQQVLMDKLEDAIEFNDIKPNVLVDMLKFFTKYLSDSAATAGNDIVGELDDKEINARAMRLLDGGLKNKEAI